MYLARDVPWAVLRLSLPYVALHYFSSAAGQPLHSKKAIHGEGEGQGLLEEPSGNSSSRTAGSASSTYKPQPIKTGRATKPSSFCEHGEQRPCLTEQSPDWTDSISCEAGGRSGGGHGQEEASGTTVAACKEHMHDSTASLVVSPHAKAAAAATMFRAAESAAVAVVSSGQPSVEEVLQKVLAVKARIRPAFPTYKSRCSSSRVVLKLNGMQPSDLGTENLMAGVQTLLSMAR